MAKKFNYEISFSSTISEKDKIQITQQISQLATSLSNNESFQSPSLDCKYIFTCGGDGTFLESVSNYKFNEHLIFIPINLGNLGFYTSWEFIDIPSIEKNIIESTISFFPVLEISYLENNKNVQLYALNEATIISSLHTQKTDISINDYFLESFHGTGLCISTPGGSTAYNKSLNGSLINPEQNLFQLVKIAPINNKKYHSISNPIILGEHDVLKLNFPNKCKNDILSIDRNSYSLDSVATLKIALSSKKIQVLSTRDSSFWKKIQKSFL